MGNIAGLLKSEISRISRREIKAALKETAKSNTTLKKAVADLKRRLAFLEKESRRFMAGTKKSHQPEHPQPLAEGAGKARLTSRGIRSLRKKLGLTRPAFAKLVGTSSQSVYMWETKEGDLNLRAKTKMAILSLRGVGVREAKKRLAQGREEAE